MTTKILEITVTGTRPLLQHSTAGMKAPKNLKSKSSEHDVVAEAELCLYKDTNGLKCIPSMHFLASMRKAATSLKKPGAGGKKSLKDFVFSGLTITELLIPLSNQTHEIDIQPVKVGPARIPRARARFDTWGATFHLEIIDEQTWDPGMVRNVLEEAGKYNGIGDYRPLYGTFSVTSATVDGKEVK